MGTGSSPLRFRPALGWDSLTDAERRVADLVARGHSNKEIADRLFMSHRTVGSHLYRIFPKLNVRSRVELTRLVIERSFWDLAEAGGVGRDEGSHDVTDREEVVTLRDARLTSPTGSLEKWVHDSV
jgi:DNA-binding CsgD family transcriptional regulator